MDTISKTKKTGITVLIVLNLMVLTGQVWPEGAPPFARFINILFLTLSLIFFISILFKSKSKQ